LGVVASLLALGVAGGLVAQPENTTGGDKKEVGEGKKPRRGGGKKGAAKRPQRPKKVLKDLEEMFGKPLTDEQKQKIEDAEKERAAAYKAAKAKYDESVAVDELKAKEKALRAKEREERKKAKENKGAALPLQAPRAV
jgi:hypothetical protein